MRATTSLARIGLVVCSVSAVSAPTFADAPKSAWSTPQEVISWVDRSVEPVTTTILSEGEMRFARIVGGPFVLSLPANEAAAGFDPELALVVIDLQQHNGVKLMLRHNMPVEGFSLLFAHRDVDYDPGFADAPITAAVPVPGDEEWHEAILLLSDAVYFDPSKEVIMLNVWPSDSGERTQSRQEPSPESLYLDISSIEFVSLPTVIPTPVISGFSPTRARYATQVTILGEGFAEPASRNVVLFGGGRVEVVSGDASTLVIRAEYEGHITVRTPGGAKAVSSEAFVLLGDPRYFDVVSGDGQAGGIGATLEPLVVRVRDKKMGGPGAGLPGHEVVFRIVRGDASFSAAEATTGEDGTAQTVLTLGSTPGIVEVEADLYGFDPLVLRITCTP